MTHKLVTNHAWNGLSRLSSSSLLLLTTVMVSSNAIWHSRSWQFSNSQLPRHTETRDYSAENANYVGWVSNTPHVYLAFSKAFEVISKIENYTEDRTIRRYYYNLKFYLPFDAADSIKWGTRLLGLFLFSKIFGVDMNNCVVFLLACDKLIFSTLYLPKKLN